MPVTHGGVTLVVSRHDFESLFWSVITHNSLRAQHDIAISDRPAAGEKTKQKQTNHFKNKRNNENILTISNDKTKIITKTNYELNLHENRHINNNATQQQQTETHTLTHN